MTWFRASLLWEAFPGSLPCASMTLWICLVTGCAVSLLAFILVPSPDSVLPEGRGLSLSYLGCGHCTWCSKYHGEWAEWWLDLTCHLPTCIGRASWRLSLAALPVSLCAESLGYCALFRVNPLKQSQGEQKHILCLKMLIFFKWAL